MYSTLLSVSLWQRLDEWDKWLFMKLNSQWTNPFFDAVFPYFRDALFWAPLYLFLLLFVTMNFGTRGLWWVAAVVVVAALSDIISSQIIKQMIFRQRPCRDFTVMSQIRFFVNYCPQSSSFTSSHATSHFAQAVFFHLTLRHIIGKWSLLFFLWALLIAYTQVYVGVHYPFDVICGSLLGCGIGFAIAKLYHNRVGMLSLDK